jgi:hypothetical protein
VWATLTDADREAYLDYQEQLLDAREALEAEFAPAVSAPVMTDVYPAPHNRAGTRKQRRKAKRANRHNQTQQDHERYAQERREGKHGSQQRDRQTFLDNQAARRNGKG